MQLESKAEADKGDCGRWSWREGGGHQGGTVKHGANASERFREMRTQRHPEEDGK